DVDRLEAAAAEPSILDDGKLGALILSARDHVVDGWVMASASILMCTAYGVVLRVLCGRDTTPLAGQTVASAESLGAVHRLAAAARENPTLSAVLSSPNCGLEALEMLAPDFHSALRTELARIGHRGPGEVEMSSPSFADNPDLLVRMVAKTMATPAPDAPTPPDIPVWAKPLAAAGAVQIREREVRRDKMVRAIWVLRALLREQGRRLVQRGVLADVDDVFYLLVDEIDAAPDDLTGLVARRRREQRELAELIPPEAFSGKWQPVRTPAARLATGEMLHGLGVCGGRVRGRVRVIVPETIDELQPGEVLVAKATDVGYTPAFAYAAAVVTELGGPLSHAAIVAREYGFPCVVGVRDATLRLADGALIEVDGASGDVTVLEG
ncbi:MAG TPA: PEP-utilizing enzyme, partial [Mycobacterium sp.]|nr:PEP-utilizing enzyme [Mycobacterium sp.]